MKKEIDRLNQLIREKDQVIMELQKELVKAYKPQIHIPLGHGGGAGGYARFNDNPMESSVIVNACNHEFTKEGTVVPFCRKCGFQLQVSFTS